MARLRKQREKENFATRKGKKEETRDTNEYVVKRNKQLSIMNEQDG